MHKVFAYGTLQNAAVMEAVTGKQLESAPALLNDYQRFKIKQRTYPGIIKSPEHFVDGVLYNDIDEQTLQLLDEFEDVCYDRCLVEVTVNEQTTKTFAYIYKDEYREHLSEQEWSLKEFERKYLKQYLKAISGF